MVKKLIGTWKRWVQSPKARQASSVLPLPIVEGIMQEHRMNNQSWYMWHYFHLLSHLPDRRHPGSKPHCALQHMSHKYNAACAKILIIHYPLPLKQLFGLSHLVHLIPPKKTQIFICYWQLSNFKQKGISEISNWTATHFKNRSKIESSQVLCGELAQRQAQTQQHWDPNPECILITRG